MEIEGDLKKCRKRAAQILNVEADELPIEMVLPELRSVYYSIQGSEEKSLIVSFEGDYLCTDNGISFDVHIKAFKSGLRSTGR